MLAVCCKGIVNTDAVQIEIGIQYGRYHHLQLLVPDPTIGLAVVTLGNYLNGYMVGTIFQPGLPNQRQLMDRAAVIDGIQQAGINHTAPLAQGQDHHTAVHSGAAYQLEAGTGKVEAENLAIFRNMDGGVAAEAAQVALNILSIGAVAAIGAVTIAVLRCCCIVAICNRDLIAGGVRILEDGILIVDHIGRDDLDLLEQLHFFSGVGRTEITNRCIQLMGTEDHVDHICCLHSASWRIQGSLIVICNCEVAHDSIAACGSYNQGLAIGDALSHIHIGGELCGISLQAYGGVYFLRGIHTEPGSGKDVFSIQISVLG